MKLKTWNDLSLKEKKTLGKVKTGVILHLLTVLNRLDDKSRQIVKNMDFQMSLKGGKDFAWSIECSDGELSAMEEYAANPNLTLKGKSTADLGALLSQKKAKVSALPGSLNFMKTVKAFKALTARIPLYLGGEEGKKNKKVQTELLLDAALMGVVQVGNYDEYVKARTGKMGSGLIEIIVGDNSELTRHLTVEEGHFYFGDLSDGNVSARLIFQDSDTAHGMLTGQLRAMSALGDSRIKIRGRIPLIQGLFPLLDRFSFFMKVN